MLSCLNTVTVSNITLYYLIIMSVSQSASLGQHPPDAFPHDYCNISSGKFAFCQKTIQLKSTVTAVTVTGAKKSNQVLLGPTLLWTWIIFVLYWLDGYTSTPNSIKHTPSTISQSPPIKSLPAYTLIHAGLNSVTYFGRDTCPAWFLFYQGK